MQQDTFVLVLSEFIESINAAWTVLDICLVTYFGYYLWSVRHKFELGWSTFYTWSTGLPLYAQAAIAIFIFHFGDMGVRGTDWLIRRNINEGYPITFAIPATVFVTVFAIIAGIGLLCKLRVFATPLFGRWVWIGGATLAGSAAILTHFLP